MSITSAERCTGCEAPCAAVCAPHHHAGHPATAPGALLRLAQGGPHPLLGWCTHCGACEAVCPHDVAVREGLRQTATSADQAALLRAWQATTPWHVHTVVWAACSSHGVDLGTQALKNAFDHHAIDGVQVVDTLPCGGEVNLPDDAVASLIAGRHRGVREIVVPTGACRAAVTAHLARAGLRGRTVAVLDQWLARFGVSVPRDSERFVCCRLRRDARDVSAASSNVWPPAPTCCGAGRPLSDVAPRVAEAAGGALLARWQEAGAMRVHVEDAACAAHLRHVGNGVGSRVEVVTRLDAFLAAVPMTVTPPESD